MIISLLPVDNLPIGYVATDVLTMLYNSIGDRLYEANLSLSTWICNCLSGLPKISTCPIPGKLSSLGFNCSLIKVVSAVLLSALKAMTAVMLPEAASTFLINGVFASLGKLFVIFETSLWIWVTFSSVSTP